MSAHPLSRLGFALCTLGLLGLSPAAGSATGPRLSPGSAAQAAGPGRVIVTYRNSHARALSARLQAEDNAPVQAAQTLSQRHGLDLRDGRTVGPRTQVLLSDTLNSEQLRQRLAADPDVASVSIDRQRFAHASTPNDPLYPDLQPVASTPTAGQWYLRTPTGTVVSSIDAQAAWDTTTGSSSIVVAVLDTGVRPEHPDLAGKLLPGLDFVSNVAVANDGGGVDGDPSDPGDWLTSADRSTTAFKGCTVTNSSWHGTQTAALVGAATNNGIGMASVGRNVMVLPLRVLGKCGGYDSDILAAIRWAAGLTVSGLPVNPHPARVINLSLGAATTCLPAHRDPVSGLWVENDPYIDAIAELNSQGTVVVVSAGNDDKAVNAPANCPGAIAVAGLRHAGTKSGYSSLGPEAAVAAPAGNCVTDAGICQYPILSASNTGTQGPAASTYSSGLGEVGLGTSFSSPLVAGSAALMLAVNPSLTAAQVKSLLTSTARPFPTSGGTAGTPLCAAPSASAQQECYCTTTTCGSGMLDTRAAVQAASANRAVAHLGGTPPLVAPGNSVTIDGSASSAAAGGSIASYAWTILAGGDAATITSAANASTVTLATQADKNGSRVTVQLTVTDTLGNTASATQTLTIGTPPSIVSDVPATAAPSGGGGGGAFDLAWAALLGLCGLAVWHRPRPRAV